MLSSINNLGTITTTVTQILNLEFDNNIIELENKQRTIDILASVLAVTIVIAIITAMVIIFVAVMIVCKRTDTSKNQDKGIELRQHNKHSS